MSSNNRTILNGTLRCGLFVLACALIWCGRALSQIGVIGYAGVPSVPADAAAFGYHTITFQDQFTSLSTIDLLQTANQGFNWYPIVAWPNSTLIGYRTATNPNPAGITLNAPGSGVRLVKGAHFMLASAATDGANGYHGHVFTNGGYFEVSMNYDPTLATSSNPSWPAFWSLSIAQLEGTPGTTEYVEPDFYEASPNNGSINEVMAAHDWTITGGGSGATSTSSSNSAVTLPGSPTLTNFHRYGTLWVPAAQNGGTGLIRRYFDGVRLSSNQGEFTYSASAGASPAWTPSNPNGVFYLVDSSQIMLILNAGDQSKADWPVNVNNVIVVQSP